MRPHHIASVVLTAAGLLPAQDWPAWRGPAGNGVSSCKTAPLSWDREKNVKWKVPLAQPANGSPIVSRGRVFLTMPEDAEGKRRSLHCYDRADGRQLWVRTVDLGRVMPTHPTNPYCGSTPAADGERVVVWHASAGLHCYDFEGKELWKRDLGEFRHQWGYGTSPVLEGGRVILHTGPGRQSFVAAFDLESGKTIWKTEEPDHLDEEARAKKRLVGSWCTPLIVTEKERRIAICGQPTRIVAYDLDDGRVLWHCGGIPCKRGDLVYSSPVVLGDVCMVMAGYEGPSIGVCMGGEGDVTGTRRLWRHPRQPSNCGSGVAAGGHIYIPGMSGSVSCIDPTTGKPTWTARVGRGRSWGSIVYAAGRLYLTIQRGTTIVFEPDPEELRILAKNALTERTNSTPAIAGGEIFLRTHRHLYCIADGG
ncbi:MAG: PQQ-binding-like beta-propeller repeat protein [Planctomycetota bacterium]